MSAAACKDTTISMIGLDAPPTTTKLPASVSVEDPRLVMLNSIGNKIVIFYAIYIIFLDQVFFPTLPMVPVNQGGKLADSLRMKYGGPYAPGYPCSLAQNYHCGKPPGAKGAPKGDKANCTIPSPRNVGAPGDGLLFRDRLYITTKYKFHTRETKCVGHVFDANHDGKLNAEEPCIGTAFPGPSYKKMDKEVYNAGIEYLQLESIHSPGLIQPGESSVVGEVFDLADLLQGNSCFHSRFEAATYVSYPGEEARRRRAAAAPGGGPA